MSNRNPRHDFFGNDCAVQAKYAKMSGNGRADGCLITNMVRLREFSI